MKKKLQKQSFTDILQNRGFLKIRKFYRNTPVLESLFNKAAGLKTCNFLKKRLQHRCFSVKFAEYLRRPNIQNIFGGYFWNETYASAAVLLRIRIGNLHWNESHEKKTKHIHDSATNLLHIRIGNLDWYKCERCKNEAREIDCLL